MASSNIRAARVRRIAAGAAVAVAIVGATPVHAAVPFRDGDAYTVRFFDDMIFDMCGIETWTTLKERWTFKDFGDGTLQLQVTRTFIPDDPRIPIEKGAGTGTTFADGTRKVVGSPLRLYDRNGGLTLMGAGLVVFDPFEDPIRTRGQYPDLSDEALTQAYCP